MDTALKHNIIGLLKRKNMGKDTKIKSLSVMEGKLWVQTWIYTSFDSHFENMEISSNISLGIIFYCFMMSKGPKNCSQTVGVHNGEYTMDPYRYAV